MTFANTRQNQKQKPKVKKGSWRILAKDCIKGLEEVTPGSVHLVCADPPFNIDRKYDNYDDRKPRDEYLRWSYRWMNRVHHALHPHGSFWLFIHDSLVSEMDVQAKDLGFYKRSHVIWAFTFGVNCARNFTRAHTHVLYYTKAKTKYTFNEQDPANRVPSARQLIYADKRANPANRLPDDVWILRPGELEEYFNGQSDMWLQSRICGTFHEKIKGLDNQIPLPIMERIVRTCSRPGDIVLDPFLGSGTTGVAAIRLGRHFQGFEISKKYLAAAAKRLKAT